MMVYYMELNYFWSFLGSYLLTPYTLLHFHVISYINLDFIYNSLGCAVFLAALDQTIVATALPKIVSDFNGLDQIAWVATSYLLTMVI